MCLSQAKHNTIESHFCFAALVLVLLAFCAAMGNVCITENLESIQFAPQQNHTGQKLIIR